MSARWKHYIGFHIGLLLLAVGFAVWAFLVERIFPHGFLHCPLHDLLHLYCPLCGGTRALRAALRGQWAAALTLYPAAFVMLPAAFILDLRAFLLLCRGWSGPLLPRGVCRAAVVGALLFTVVRDTALLAGFDPVGDLWPFWRARAALFRTCLFPPLLLLLAAAFASAVGVGERAPRPWDWLTCGAFLGALLAVLYLPPRLLWLLALPALLTLLRVLLPRMRQRKGNA